MSHKKSSAKSKPQWYYVDIVVELLIHETPRGEKFAPEIGNLCVGFSSLTLDKLEAELEDIRSCWPAVFPKTLKTEEILKLIKKKYPAYEELLELKDAG